MSYQFADSLVGDRQYGESRQFPPNYEKIVSFLKLMMKALLIILGLG